MGIQIIDDGTGEVLAQMEMPLDAETIEEEQSKLLAILNAARWANFKRAAERELPKALLHAVEMGATLDQLADATGLHRNSIHRRLVKQRTPGISGRSMSASAQDELLGGTPEQE